jgi:hypothetical protein
MMSLSRLYNVAGVGACKPILLQPILISMIFEHYEQLNKIEKMSVVNDHTFNHSITT